MQELKYVGKPLPRKDALKKITGEAVFGADVALPGQLYAAVLRSPHAHAKILKVNTSEAKKIPGVRLVLTGQEVPVLFGQFMRDQPILAIDLVRYQGEPVAIAAADSPEAARMAMDAVEIEYELLTPVKDIDDAIAENPVLVHEDWKAYKWSSAAAPVLNSNICDRFHLQNGDPDTAFEKADVVVENVYETSMIQHATMETHASTALFDSNGLTIWTPAQSPFMLRGQLSEVFELPITKVRLITTEVGGGFGSKYELRAEPLVAILAMRLPGRPIKLTFNRNEEFKATGVRAPSRVYIKTAANKDGLLVAQDIQVYWDTGAYVTTGPRVNYNAGIGASTPYKTPHIRIDGYCVVTNKPLGTAFRGFGASEVTWAYENQMDILAEKLGLDPVDFRMRNLLGEGDLSPSGERVTAVGVKECLEAVAKSIGWEGPGVQRMPDGKLRAKGLACFSKVTGTPSNSSVILKMNDDASVNVMIGGKELGQGVETVIPQIVAEALGVPVENVEVAPVDTLYAPYEKTTTGSRLTFHVGQAAIGAVEDMKNQIKIIASEYWGIDKGKIVIEEGIIREIDGEQRSVPVAEMKKCGSMLKEQKPIIGRYSLTTNDSYVPLDKETGLSPRPSVMWFWGAQAAEVEIDPETGNIDVIQMTAAHDVGKAINPVNCRQQIEGSVIMGIGTALTEEVIFDDQARLVNGNLMDFKVLTARDVDIPIGVTFVEKAHKEGPYGAKGVGEPGLVPTAAAIGNAVAHASGVRLKSIPMKPEHLYFGLKGGQ